MRMLVSGGRICVANVASRTDARQGAVSPNDSPGVGTVPVAAWPGRIVDPVRRNIMVVARDAPMRLLHESETLDGGSVMPGFSCAVSEVFKGIARDLA
jgi:hypothetical protein